MKSIRLADIVTDAGTQVRAAINEDVVSDYAEQMRNGVAFPPIVLFHDGSQYHLADGFHRVMAARRAGWIDFNADVQKGTKTDALWYALGANRENGARLTSADKRHAILLALKAWYFDRPVADKSINQIADQIGCNQPYVLEIAKQHIATNKSKQPERVQCEDGRIRPATRTPKPEPSMQSAPVSIGARRAAAEAYQGRIAAAAEGASDHVTRKLPRKNPAELITNVVHTLQGVASALEEIDPSSVLSDAQAPYWRHHIAEAIGALRKFNKRLRVVEAA